jgi:hypothetical protein
VVLQTYRVSAVRRPPATQGVSADTGPTTTADYAPSEGARTGPIPVTDEEIIHTLWTGRDRFLARVADLLREQLRDEVRPCEVVEVVLVDLRPAGSVLLALRYTVRFAGRAVSLVDDFTRAVIVAVAEELQSALGDPVAVAAAPEVAAPPPADSGASTSWGKIAPVLAAIGTGIGVVGFVTFVGGVIVWARLNAAGFPAAPALSVYPKQDLLVIGAQTLVEQVLIALIPVAVLGVVYAVVRAFSGRVGEAEAAIVAGQANRLSAIGMFVFILGVLLAIVVLEPGLHGDQRVLAAWGAFGAASIAGAIGSVTRRFLYLAATTVLVVGVFMGFVAYGRARVETKVRGAAIMRAKQKTTAGIFLTEGAGRVYLARVTYKKGRVDESQSRLVGIDKSEVTDVAIAGAKPVGLALADARALERELCDLQPRVPTKEQGGDCGGKPLDAGPTITRYGGADGTIESDRAVRLTLPALSEDATGVVSLVTRDQVVTTDARGARRREQVALSTKPFRAQANHPIRVRFRLSRRARLVLDETGGALPVRVHIVAIGSTGFAGRDDESCVVLRVAHPRRPAHC